MNSRHQLTAIFLMPVLATLKAADQPQWGEAWTRNLVSAEKGLPETFSPQTKSNIKWIAKLGTETHSTPIIAGGRVYVGTNNNEPRDPRQQGDRGVLMCFDEKDGHLLWQLVAPKRDEDKYYDWPNTGMSSPVTVEGDRVYVVDNRGEVLCLDARGMTNGNDGPFRDEAAHMAPKGTPPVEPADHDADILWTFDMMADAGIWCHDGAHSSILIRGPHLYVNTGTGVDNTHRVIRTPDAPSLIVLDKATGRLLARDEERIAPEIFHATWSSPSSATVNGRPLVFFAGGNGIVYAFEPLDATPAAADGVQKLKKVWSYDPDPTAPKTDVHRFTTNRQEGPSDIFAMPVFHDGRLFIAAGGDIFWGKTQAWLKCVDATSAAPAEIWSYPLNKHVMSTPAVADGLVYIADVGRTVHCLDAKTGRPYWTHEAKGEFWASPLVADGKVFIGSRKGDFTILAAGREKRVLAEVDLTSPISATATAANGTLFIATMTHLFAVQSKATEK